MSNLNDLLARKNAMLAGNSEKIAMQKKQGKLTARERIQTLLDEGSFIETDAFIEHCDAVFGFNKPQIAGDGVITAVWNCPWLSGIRIFSGFYSIWRFHQHSQRTKSYENIRIGYPEWLSDYRNHRLSRGKDPRRCRIYEWVQRYFKAYRFCLWRDPARLL